MKKEPAKSPIRRVAFIGNYLPRQCGIATFTTDLCEAIAGEFPGTACLALPVNDTEESYAYPPRVRFELTEKDVNSYLRAADFLAHEVSPVFLVPAVVHRAERLRPVVDLVRQG